jgi:putative membrane-bound dehydrogenase-like protein
MSPSLRAALAAAALVVAAAPAFAQKEYGFDNRKPSGQPYLKPEESVARMKVADGFEVKLFAAEPMVVNPVAMTVDEKGRVWVIECFEYPKRTAKGKMPRDRIVILEDTKGTGVADKRTVFAEGKDFPVPFDLATGLEVGNGGVYVGAPPYLFFIENKNDRPGKFEILLKGFGSQDTHETLNTFQWGPDGRLYGLHGVFTQSEVIEVASGGREPPAERPDPKQGADAPRSPTRLNAGVWRYDTRVKKFEVFAEGTSNPWGMDWRNTDGQFILCCCVIPHLYHIVPGGIYKRQAGQSFNPYAFGEIKEICDHTFHKESGWAHAGLISLDTPLMPEKYRSSVIFGSIHGCSIKQNILKRNGSTYTASRGDDFLVSGDKNFRPINLRWGHNGEIYCIDWHDQNPCHQAAADSWDYEHGRVYRIQQKGARTKTAEDLGKKTDLELVKLLADPNPYVYRTAHRLFGERGTKKRDDQATSMLYAGQFRSDLRFLWAEYAMGRMSLHDEEVWRLSAESIFHMRKPYSDVTWSSQYRTWFLRFLGESEGATETALTPLVKLAREEDAPEARLQIASTAIGLGSKHNTTALLHALMEHKEDATDPAIPLIIWLAYEKQISQGRTDLDWLRDNAAGNPLITNTIVPNTMRRLASGGKAEDLKKCLAFVAELKDRAAKRKALEGLTTALKGRVVDAPENWKSLHAVLLKDDDAEIVSYAKALAINFRDPAAVRAALAVARDKDFRPFERADSIRALGLLRPDEGRAVLLEVALTDQNANLRVEALRALSGYDGPDIPREVLKGWKDFPPAVRSEAVNLLAGRKEWARDLLAAVGDKRVPRTDLTNNTILRILAFKDKKLDDQIKAVWGQVRDTPAELNKLIDTMRGELYKGPASFERGRKVFENQCAKCHTFEGKGHKVGPELDGAGRDIEYLLVNILDPNRVVGAPYFQRVANMKKGQVYVGLLAAEDADTVTLKAENDTLRVLPKKEIDTLEVVEKSMMPEGLDKNMTVQDFRDLIRYAMAHPYLSDVDVTGPYPGEGPIFDLRERDAIHGAKWTPVAAGTPGRIALPASKEKSVAFVRAEVMAQEVLRTRLLLGAGQPIKVWLNGKAVYEGTPGDGSPDQAGVDVELRPGENRLYVRAAYQGDKAAVFARFLDPDRKIRYPEAKDR